MNPNPGGKPEERIKILVEHKMAEGQDCYFDLVDNRLKPRPEQRLWLQAHQNKMARMLDLQPDDHIVDLGCGEGFYTLHLAKQVKSTTAFDFAEGGLRLFRKQPGFREADISLAAASGGFLPLSNESVDKLLCNHVLEHVIDDHAVVAEICRVLKPGGKALIGVPLSFSPQVRLAMRVRRLLHPSAKRLRLEQVRPGALVPELVGVENHVRFYSLEAVFELLKGQDLRPIKAEGIGLSFNESIRGTIRRSPVLFSSTTALGRLLPGIGDGVLVLAQKANR